MSLSSQSGSLLAGSAADKRHLLAEWRNAHGMLVCAFFMEWEARLLVCEWNGFRTQTEDATAALERMVTLARYTGATRILNDDRKHWGDWPDIHEWMGSVWRPNLVRAGIRKFAHIYSQDLLSQLSAKRLLELPATGMALRNFGNEAVARAWLLEAD